LNDDEENWNSFIDEYHLEDYEDMSKLVIALYFSLTTLTTVGYGDMSP